MPRPAPSPCCCPGTLVMRLSAGYTTFAEGCSRAGGVFPPMPALADPNARRAGLGVAYEPNSGHGVYWVLVLDD